MTDFEKNFTISKFKHAKQFMLSLLTALECNNASEDIISEVSSLEEQLETLEKKFAETN